jgi:agmatine deiminase
MSSALINSIMPAEWEQHTATWTSWPFNEELWHGHLEKVRAEFAELVKTISFYEPVHILTCDDNTLKSAKEYLKNCENITFHSVPLNDIWFRDNGPIFIKQGANSHMTKWEFNSWGQKFKWDLDNLAAYHVAKYLNKDCINTNIVMEGGSLDVNGEGVALTTKQCLFSKMRNPTLTQQDIEAALEKYLGIKKLLWLENGLEGDHTDGHIDTIVRFVNKNTILCSLTEDKFDKNYETMNYNYKLLQSFTNLKGEHFNIVPLVLPKNKMFIDEDRLPATYANFYIGNGFVVVPTYDDPHDEIALNTIKKLFPNRKVVGLKSKYIITGGGSFHCVTQQQPA